MNVILKNEAVTIYEMNNGMKVIFENVSHVASVAMSVWVKVGSRFELPEESGISHFIEHMAFKGTKTRDKKDIAIAFDEIGAAANACTSREYTQYHVKCLSEDCDKALDILADIVVNSIFPEEEIEKEKDVVLQEITHTNDTPDDIVFDKHMECCYPNQPMGCSVLGDKDKVRSFTRQQILHYTGKHYTGGNMILSVAGAYDDEESILSKAESLFKAIPSSTTNVSHKNAVYSGGEYRDNRDLEQLQLILGFPGVGDGSGKDDFYSYCLAFVTGAILGGGMSSRLFQEIRDNLGLAYSISSYSASYSDTGVFNIYTGTFPEKVLQVMRAVAGEMRDMSKGIEIDELDRAKKQCKAGMVMQWESTLGISTYNGKMLMRYGRHVPAKEILQNVAKFPLQHFAKFPLQEILQNVALITTEDVRKFVAGLLHSADKLSVAAVGNIAYLPDYKDCVDIFSFA